MSTAKKLVLVDGSALIYRAYFAIPSRFTNSEGLHTNAIFGFTTMFKKLFTGRKPSHGAVVFDAPGKTFRAEKYDQYKAQRPPMPDDMREQLEHIDRVVHAHNFPLLRMKGYEADDVIGTLSRMGQEAGLDVVIVSGDKDFAQLVNDKCKMQDTMRDVTYDADLVKKKWGVPPHQIVDMLALWGDKADNIPGVPGIGQKGSAQLLEEYGSLDGILKNIDKFKGKRKENLENHQDDARLSQELATIDQHVPVTETLDDLLLEHPEQDTLNDLYKEFNFFSLLKASAKDDATKDIEVKVAESVEDLEAFVKEHQQPLALDMVFDEVNPAYGDFVGLTLATKEKRLYLPVIAPADSLGKKGLLALKPFLESKEHQKVVHNAKFWMSALEPLGITLEGVLIDTMLASFLIDPAGLVPHGLPQLAKEYLQEVLPNPKDVIGAGKKQKRFAEIEAGVVASFSAKRCDVIARSFEIIQKKLDDEGRVDILRDLDLPLSRVLSKIERHGIYVDKRKLNALGKEFQARLDSLSADIYKHAGKTFNINSPKQLAVVLFEDLKLPVIKKTKTGYSTNADVLLRLEDKHPIAALLLEQRKLQKLINTYTEVLQKAIRDDGRVHSTFQQTAGVTGRLITTEPDLQRTPVRTEEGAKIRYAFTAQKGNVIVAADWSQIELRVLAHMSKDPTLIDCYENDIDVHTRTASEVLGIDKNKVTKKEREMGKTINFATIYGQGATALGQMLKVKRKEAKSYIEKYFETYEGVAEWVDATKAEAHDKGYVETLFFRRRYISELSSNSSMDRAFGERIAANTPIQGTAADLCKIAMLNIDAALEKEGLDAQMVLQIHDELLFECKEEDAQAVRDIVIDAMENVWELDVPLVVDAGIGKSWGDAKQ